MTFVTLNLRVLLNKFVNVSRVSSAIRGNHVWNSDNVVKSPFKDVRIPNSTVVEYVWNGLDKWPTKTAAVCAITNRGYTYEQIYRKTQIFAANLRKKLNIKCGDTVGVMSPNTPEYPIISFGVLTAGGVVTTLNPVYTAYEVQRQIELSELKLMIAHVDVVSVVKKALKLAKKDLPIIAVNFNQCLPEETISFNELAEDNNVDIGILKDVNRTTDDVSFLPYSSGTTGLPKGVELTNRNFVANCVQQETDVRQYSYTTELNQDAVLAILPLFHSYGLSIIMLHKLSVGAKMVTLPKFQPDTFVKALLEYKINLLYLAPPMVLFLGSNPQITPKHFETIRLITSGAAPLPSADIEKMLSKSGKPDIGFCQGYGMTEASPLVTLSVPGAKKYDAVGHAIPNVELRVVDGEMRNLGPGKVGELVIRGPNIMKGYKNNQDANKEVFLEGGWYRSGDVANIDETGLVYITDRLKELIKVKGYQVPPAELENVLKEHPAVHDAAVIGIPDPKTGERPKAFIIQTPGIKVKSEDIIDFVSKRVAPYKKINDVVFVDSIPKNASGKILRRMLKDM